MTVTAEPKPYQVPAIEKGKRLKRCVIRSPMGSGKTFMCIKILDELGAFEPENWPLIIVCRKNAQATWPYELQKWCDFVPPIAVMPSTWQKRERVWKHCRNYGVILLTPAAYQTDKKRGWIPEDHNLVVDEPHRFMRKMKKVQYDAIRSNTLHSDIILLPTGTPMRKGPQDLFAMVHLCNREAFSSYWRYVNTWCNIIDNGFGQEIVGPKNLANFKKEVLGRHTVWVTNKDVEPYLPKKHKVRVPITPTDEQVKLINQVDNEMRIETEGGRLMLTPSSMVKIIRIRQLLVCPKIINSEYGYGAMVEETVDRVIDSDAPRPVIFTPFTEAIPFIREALTAAGEFDDFNRKIHVLQGGLETDEVHRIVTSFNKSTDDVMICSVLYAESFEFPRSKVAFFCGFDWSWDNNEQAEDRIRRLSSESPNSTYFYMFHPGYIDEYVLTVVLDDHRNVRMVTPKDALEVMTRRVTGAI